MFGYYGKLLEVDLTNKETTERPIDDAQLSKFIGGASLAAALVYGSVRSDMDPLAPDNPLVFAAGPFTGTTIPMVSRSVVCGVSPLTGIWGEATTGGVFPFRLKATGYDAILITGKADRPTYLSISDGKMEFKDASRLWGKDIYQTQELLKDELRETGLSACCIGAAGENLVRYACVMNDRGRAAGRCGLGALMGSKNLKALAVNGKHRAELADASRITELSEQARDTISTSMLTAAYREYGTEFFMDIGMFLGDAPAKYFTRGVFGVEKVTGQALRQAYSMDNHACSGCPVACGRVVRDFRGTFDRVDGPEYETVAAFGPLCMNFDLDSIVYVNHLCNAHGIDTISAGVSVAYAMHLYEQGILSEDRAGIRIAWGDSQAIVKLVEMIVGKQGIGELLGQGVRRMAEELGADPDEAAHVKGLEMPMHDARAYTGQAISYATGPRGACHLKGDYYAVDLAGRVPELGIESGDRFQSEGKAVLAAKYQSFKDMYDALLLCKFAPLSLTQITETLNGITGWDLTPTDIETAGERSLDLKRAISNKLGVTREDDRLPGIVLQPLQEGSTVGRSPDLDLLLRDYYKYREWDWDTGKPTREKLVELGLEDVARDLWPG